MNFKQLEAYVSVVKHRSFSRAAAEIYLSQPTVSAYVHALESECGTMLLLRSTREVYPTPAGERFYEYARELLDLRDKALHSVRRCSTEVSGRLELAASTVPAQYLLPDLLAEMAAKYPQLYFVLKQYDSQEVARHIANLDAELGIVGTSFEHSDCVFTPFAQDQLVVITPNTPEYRAISGPFPFSLLEKAPFLTREPGSGTRREMEEALRRAGLTPERFRLRAQLDSTESIKQAVSQGLGISIVSRRAVEQEAGYGQLRLFALEHSCFTRRFYFVYRKNWPLSPAAERLMELAREKAALSKAPSPGK